MKESTKGKNLFVNSCEHKLLISTATKFLNACQDGTNASKCLGIMLKNIGTSVE
jgi:hypothetical protein